MNFIHDVVNNVGNDVKHDVGNDFRHVGDDVGMFIHDNHSPNLIHK